MRITFSLLGLLLFVISSSYGQKNESIDVSYRIGQSFRSLSSSGSARSDQFLQLRSQEESNKNYKVSIGYNKSIYNNLLLKTGLSYSTYGYTTSSMDSLRWPSEIGPNGYQRDPSLPHEFVLSESHRFLSIPLLIRYEIFEKIFSPYVEIGFSGNYYLTTQDVNETDISTDRTSTKRDFSSFNIFGNIAFGSNYNVTNDFQLYAQLYYDRQLNSLVKSDYSESLNSYGIEFGIRRKF